MTIPILGMKMPIMGISAERDTLTSVADALFTTTQQRVLALLFGQPTRSYFATELIRLTRSGSGAVQRELRRLTSSGLVTMERIGRQKHYRANPSSPVFEELRLLVLKTLAVAGPIQAALEQQAERIELALIFGSVAKGCDTAGSDIDLLVVADDMTLEELYACLATVEEELSRKISPTLYSKREYADRRARESPFLSRVLSGEHQLLMGSVDGSR